MFIKVRLIRRINRVMMDKDSIFETWNADSMEILTFVKYLQGKVILG